MIRSTKRRGRHKIFIGMAPGVGKTCRMLQEGKEALSEGRDVVIGLLETHGRQDTAHEAIDLEQVPRKRILHAGVTLEEMDVAAVIARHPQLALVDELAHTNAPGSERDKRWQDVEALLLCGIDVYSTLNIQHLESLNDVVADLTGVVVRERIPNRVLERADAVVLVDVTPETLRQRLEEGKVYAHPNIQQALTHFFQHRHLVALRELALREVADRVEEQAPQATRLLRERVMVCVPASPVAERLLRRAARLAAALDAPLIVLTVQPTNRLLSREEAKVLETCERLCADLGATFLHQHSNDRLATIANTCREQQISQIVLGQTSPATKPWRLRRPFYERLQRRLEGLSVDLHLITTGPEN